MRATSDKNDPATPRGPVQRRTEPNPFEKKAEAEVFGVWVTGPMFEQGAWCTYGSGKSCVESSSYEVALLALQDMASRFRCHTYEVRPYTAKPKLPAPFTDNSITVSRALGDELTLTEERLARLLFETDETVRLTIAEVDDHGDGSFLCAREGPYAIDGAELFERAWRRDEGGRRNWAQHTAACVFGRARHLKEGGGT